MYKNRTHIFSKFSGRKGQIAILIDPEKVTSLEKLTSLLQKAIFAKIDYFFIGGSTVTRNEMEMVVSFIKEKSSIPVVIFPGAHHQISHQADALLFLSLISGRNPDFLIGHHVMAAQELHPSPLEIIPTSYILIDGGTKSSVAYISQTTPIPNNKEQIAIHTAIAGSMLGQKVIYFDAGSGAKISVPLSLVKNTHQELPHHPILVGGGIRTIEKIKAFQQIANVIVVGNHIEDNENFLLDLANLQHQNS